MYDKEDAFSILANRGRKARDSIASKSRSVEPASVEPVARSARPGYLPSQPTAQTRAVEGVFRVATTLPAGFQSQHERNPRRLQHAGRCPGTNALRLVLQSLSL